MATWAMTALKIFGSTTSPYVRRVRIVTSELGIATEWTDTSTDGGQAELRALSPIWKVPVARIDQQLIYDSAQINRMVLARWGNGTLLRYDELQPDDINLIMVIDGALDALINSFYLSKDGITPATSPYVKKQHERASASLAWLEQRVKGPYLGRVEQFGLCEIALISALDWMRLRNTFDVDSLPGLSACAAAHATRPSIKSTTPS